MTKGIHLSDTNLVLFTDGELGAKPAAKIDGHLKDCAACRERLGQLKRGAAAYEQYREQILTPAVAVPEWRVVRERIAQLETPRKSLRIAPALLWAGAAACSFVIFLMYRRHSPLPSVPELLTKAAAVHQSTRRPLLFKVWGLPVTSKLRLRHVQTLFVQASYSWDDPLSARSFAAWRNQLREKEDQVTLVRGGTGTPRYYRVRTHTTAGILRTASLTLQAQTYHATDAAFEFEGDDRVELTEGAAEDSGRAWRESQSVPVAHPKSTETVVGPEDELRVFAALNAVGADVEEPIDVKLDAEHNHVLVTGMGLTAVRQIEVQKAVADLPKILVRFDSVQRFSNDSEGAKKADTYSADNASAFLKVLETRVGGPRQLQSITDRALDTSNALFARAHSLLRLAQEFPPKIESGLHGSDREILLGLQQRHVGAIEYAARQLREDLGPLLEAEPAPDDDAPNLRGRSWQEGAANLFEASRNLNERISRLLAGSYAERDGEEMLKRLPRDLSKLEMLIREQALTGR